jgi:hypothetical protein
MSDPTNTPDPDAPPPEVQQEIADWLDEYEKSMRKGLDEYFKGKKPDSKPKPDDDKEGP